MKSMFEFYAKYTIGYRGLFVVYYFLVIFCGFLSLLIPLLNGKIVDIITCNQKEVLNITIFLFLIVNFLVVIINFLKNRTYIKLQTNTTYRIIKTIIDHIQHLPIRVLDSFDIGYMNQKINSDSNSVTMFLINFIGDFSINIITIFFSICILVKMNIIIGITMVGIGCIYIVIYIALKKIIYRISFIVKEEQATFFSAMLMQLKDVRFIKIHSLVAEYKKKMNKRYQQYYLTVVKSQNFFFLYSSLDALITIVANGFVFAVGGHMVMNGSMTIGEFTVVLSYFNYIIASFKYFSSLAKEYQENKVAYNRILEIFNLKHQDDGKLKIAKIRTIACENISFIRSGKILFKNLNYIFEPGKIYCICGENGKGKTTLIETIIGIHEEEYTGRILYNNINTKELNMYRLRSNNISVMEQQIVLQEGSVEENIFLSTNHSMKNINKIQDIDKQYNLEEFKLYGEIHSNGSGISGGECQKIGLYRLFSKDADVYILDEPTASLDKGNVIKFMNFLNQIKEEKIVIIISHDSTTIDMCDEIINL